MSYKLEFKIDGLPKTINAFLSKGWKVRWAHSKKWKMFVEHAVLRSGGYPPQPLKKAKVTMVRHSSRKLDRDNLYGSFKPVIDALKSDKGREARPASASRPPQPPKPYIPRVVEDDTEDVINLECLQVTAPRGTGFIVVTIEEIV